MKNNSSTTVGKVGHRFISKGRTAYKIHVPDSSITVQHLSVGFIKLGEKEALKIAIKKRNQLGKKFWGKHWKRILEDELLLGRLPRSLEPTLVYKPTPTLSDPDKKELCYLTKWRVLNTNSGKYQYKTVVRSIGKYGKLSAYIQTKSALLEAYSDILPIIEHIGRYSFAKFK
ncbi:MULTISPECIES: Fe3+-citrate ABC transporter substrate-binding protein [Vibrio]|uniref:Fe3+-citrate ABC transporter substrate-binding protein n=2 Tax=Vibrio TaxID=662 RepID=A0A2N7NCV1_9VIBR|nr:Fe3+-citrate ABC transporter substrate-binding protein [Vibrio tasmaniensis]PMO89918.1 Fe3+-citrate ABC transporter substrate-binding protein [Vibrio tasmaniensis]PMP10032.1 Fe3+-citrate ABC transporter substrate-binding protein [Vibrio tasmaniensis]TKG32643.1 Fe3+-citrate ABC transporter substrate-binding protein [Vibrio tasmaniensis]TKG41731.1 Fe3+-citrate ABC transporter substrate-binding protein [Vibrio tasmaniensis]TKG52085.1 Fe3+-citrate ABC transporter substrate-binding protein [Vibr